MFENRNTDRITHETVSNTTTSSKFIKNLKRVTPVTNFTSLHYYQIKDRKIFKKNTTLFETTHKGRSRRKGLTSFTFILTVHPFYQTTGIQE